MAVCDGAGVLGHARQLARLLCLLAPPQPGWDSPRRGGHGDPWLVPRGAPDNRLPGEPFGDSGPAIRSDSGGTGVSCRVQRRFLSVQRHCPDVRRRCPPVQRRCSGVQGRCSPVQWQCPGVQGRCPPVQSQCPGAQRGCTPEQQRCSPLPRRRAPVQRRCTPEQWHCPARPARAWHQFRGA